MLKITQAFLDACPAWAAEGWEVNDQVNLVPYIQNNSNLVYFKEHPPHKPITP